MSAPADPPTVAAAAPQKAEVATPKRRRFRLPGLSRRVGCLAVWLLFLTPVIYSLLLVYFPRLEAPLGPGHPLQPWLARGPADSLGAWVANVDPGPTMVYLIFAAVLALLTVAAFVPDEPRSRP